MKNKERRQNYFIFLLFLTIAQMARPSLQYSKVAAVGPKTVQKSVSSRSTASTTMGRQNYYPFHYSAAEVVSNPGQYQISPPMDKRETILEKSTNSQPHLNSFNVGHHHHDNEDDEDDGQKIRSIKSTRKFPMTYTTKNSVAGGGGESSKKSDSSSSTSPAVVSALRALGEGLSVKLANFVERTVPKQYLGPLKNVVAAGKRVYENWEVERRSRGGEARQGGGGGGGGGGTSLSDLMDYGWDQVSKLRESYQSLWPPSDELAHRHEGWGHVASASSHHSSGWPGHSSGWSGWTGWSGSDSGLDTFALLAALAFGAFLLQLFLALSTTTARALGRSTSMFEDWVRPLLTSDLDREPDFLNKISNEKDPIDEDTLNAENSKGHDDDARIKREADNLNLMMERPVVGPTFKKSVESRVAAGEVLDCEKIKEEMKGAGRDDVNLIIKNAKCPPIH